MTPERFDELLANSLGGELSQDERVELEAELRRDPQRAALAARLAGVSQQLRDFFATNAQATETAAPAPTIRLSRSPMDQANSQLHIRSRGPWVAALRYAAMILLAFGAGYASNGALPTAMQSRGTQVAMADFGSSVDGFEVDSRLAARYANAVRRLPGSSSFARSLLAVARQ